MKRILVVALTLLACTVNAAPVDIRLWRHETDDREMTASAQAIERFNRRQSNWRIVTETLPQGSYQQAVVAAAMTNKLPCVLDLDQPTVPNFAWAGHIQPLEGPLKPAGADALIPGGRSSFKGRLYAVGQFDVALVLFARKSVLAQHGVRLATLERPYSAQEFRTILRGLRRAGFAYPLDLNMQLKGEWISYAFSPWLQSAGTDLVDRKTFTVVDGVLNSDAAIGVVDYFRSLFDEHLVARNPLDDQSFPLGRAAFHYSGSWSADAYRKAFGDDLVALPPPAFGAQPRIGAGSWQWAVASSCPYPQAARALLEHLISPQEIASLADATGLMPTSEAAADASQSYRRGAFGRNFFEFARALAVVRPETPGYPMISSAFERALKEAREGVDSAEALDRAVEAIAQDLKRNRNYGF